MTYKINCEEIPKKEVYHHMVYCKLLFETFDKDEENNHREYHDHLTQWSQFLAL